MTRRKTWREKLADDKDLPRVAAITGRMSEKWGAGTCVIPAPREVDEVMRKARRGKVLTVQEIRAHLAKKHHATIGCPLTTGIFAWIAAHAAAEAESDGARRITPFWRTLKSGGELNAKFPGGVSEQRRRLEAEGHCVVRKGKRLFVANFEKALAKL